MSTPQPFKRRHQHWELGLLTGEPAPSLWGTLWGVPDPPPDPEDAPTYSGALDGERLTSQLDAVLALMADNQWRSLAEIRAAIRRGSEAGLSARLREIRNSRRGVVERRRRGDPKQGLWEYRCLLK